MNGSARFLAFSAAAALTLHAPGSAGAQSPAQAADATLAAAVAAVSTERLRTVDERLVAFGTRNTFSDTTSTATRGVFAARDWIASRLRDAARTSGGRMSVALDEYVQAPERYFPRSAKISSVVATLRGDEAGSRTYVLSSHYDSRRSDGDDPTGEAPGADDNGSAVTCVLEAARVLAPLHFRATLLFAAYDAEEQGTYGSAHHAKALKAAGVDVEGDVNSDIIGASTDWNGLSAPNLVRLHSTVEDDSASRQLARFARDAGLTYVPSMQVLMINRADRFLRGGDQESFQEQGFPGIRFTETYENFDHQHQNVRVENGKEYGDLIRFMDFEYLTRVCRINVATVGALGLAPGAVRNLKLDNRTLSNDSTLTWEGVPGAAGYEVVVREPMEAYWRAPLTTVGAGVTTVTVRGYPRDNWLFGVRAFDAQGHRGVVAFPAPQR
ncbi:MAG: M28 family peptidase [Candidatus Eremiobacteraeota bacterium]|nr:M28 family peptidase [Candidatus Eremiobacteraeota bacterium]